MVKRTWFNPEVSVSLGKRGQIRNINSLELAAETLMSDDWPVHGPMCERAAVKLIEALGGDAPPDEARLAFIEAAREAGVLVARKIRELP